MGKGQPKKNLTTVRLKDKPYGMERRISYGKTILDKETVFPKPLEYEDIDAAFTEFVDKMLDLVYDGKKIPTFTLYSNQRFSEYGQMWEHLDKENNLLMNFKTVNRSNNPGFGSNQGDLYNIPGERRYTLLMRTVLEDNGTEACEIYSMKQPYCVDLKYRINFVATKNELINEFNMQINNLFKAKQCYIRPNGHFIPMTLEDVSDESQYSIEERKFFVQSVEIKAMAYIIRRSDFKVEKRPKRISLTLAGDAKKRVPLVEIEEYEGKLNNKGIDLSVSFEPYHDKVEFDIDTDMTIEKVETDNVRSYRISVNGTPYYTEKGFSVKNGDTIKIKIIQYEQAKQSTLKFIGYSPNEVYYTDNVPEKVSDTATEKDTIIVE